MTPIDLRKVLKNYKKQWVALYPNSNKVVASGKELSLVLSESKKKGVKSPTVFKANHAQKYFVG